MADTQLSLELDGAVARIMLSSEDGENLLDGRVARGLADACEEISGREEVRAVILAAEGRTFSAGWDWRGLTVAAEGGSLVEAARAQGLPGDPFGCLGEMPRPVVCALNGDAAGGGLELALACDIRVAAEGARFWFPEIGMGMLPLAGGVQRLVRLVGRGNALQMLLTGDPVDARAALAAGLAGAVVPGERLAAEAERIAATIAERGPIAEAFAKEAVSRGIDMPLEQALRFETDLTIILQTTEDRAEGVRAFLEKRKPQFKGR
jgi:enoyl-CoA hydratase